MRQFVRRVSARKMSWSWGRGREGHYPSARFGGAFTVRVTNNYFEVEAARASHRRFLFSARPMLSTGANSPARH
jgi:hypothetical protein